MSFVRIWHASYINIQRENNGHGKGLMDDNFTQRKWRKNNEKQNTSNK